MYDAVADPYCYPGTTVLKNILDIHDQAALDEFEAAITAQRADEPLPGGRFSIAQCKAIHHHLFQDVYAWAGTFRTVRIGKDGSAFCYPENIDREMKRLFAVLKHERYFNDTFTDGFCNRSRRLSVGAQRYPSLSGRQWADADDFSRAPCGARESSARSRPARVREISRSDGRELQGERRAARTANPASD
jgi:hypothetical protein